MRSQLIRSGILSITIKIVGVLLNVLAAVMLARGLGPGGYGVFTYVSAIAALLAIPAQIGLPTLVVRETAMAKAEQNWGRMRGLWRWSSLVATSMCLCIGVVVLAVGGIVHHYFTDMEISTLGWSLLLVPLVSLGNLRGGALRGLHHVVAGQLPELVLRPGFFSAFLLLGWLVLSASDYTPANAMAVQALAAALAFGIGDGMLRRAQPVELRLRPPAEVQGKRWLGSAVPLAFVAGMMAINQRTDVLLIGIFGTAEDVGIYRIAISGADLVAFGLQAMTMVVAPHFARLHAERNMARLQRLVTQSARLMLIPAIPTALILATFGKPLLSSVVGPEYEAASVPLAILAFGQVGNVAMGSVGTLLNMTGHERDTARGVAVAAATNLVLNTLLIPFWGMSGAAFATVCSMIVWNVVLSRSVRARININPSAFFLGGRPQ